MCVIVADLFCNLKTMGNVKFDCLERRGACEDGRHEMSAVKVRGGLEFVFDGQTRVISAQEKSVPSADYLGRSNVFGTHEHCIRDASHVVNEMIKGVMGR